MQFRTSLITILFVVVLTAVSYAEQEASNEQVNPAGDTKQAVEVSFPYVAEIVDDNVNIRSGPGTNYYRCGKLGTGDRVKAVGSKYSWLQIVPPEGNFSWISSQYVSIDSDDPQIGIVTGDAVRVYAGSEYVKPIHSTTMQVKLNREDMVKLLGEQEEDYYKIVPPEGAYLWVSTRYTQFLAPAGQVPVTLKSRAVTEAKDGAAVASTPLTGSEYLKKYYTIEKRFQDEKAKPVIQQDYTEIKKVLQELAGNKASGKAARYARFAVEQLKRCELAVSVAKEIEVLDSNLQRLQAEIEKERAEKLSQVPELGQFIVVGKLQASTIYVGRRYQVIDDTGKIICYAISSGPISAVELNMFLGKKVGLMGTVGPDAEAASALVKFTDVVEL
ncbi:MAG: SH3 domain-containing protein [Planctomycetota bacterium]|jgi:uncharacterized protein YraI